MANGALAFLAGLGSGYLSEGKRQEDKARQDKLDQIRLDEADRAKSEWDLNDKKRKDIAEAAKDGGGVVNDAQVVTGLAANPATYQDKDLAASDMREGNRMLRQAPSNIAATYGIKSEMATPAAPTAQPMTSMAAMHGIMPPPTTPAASNTSPAAPIAVTRGAFPRDSASVQSDDQSQPIASQAGISMAPLGKPMFQGKVFADTATAQAAADSYNSADARNARIAQAMRTNGDHEGAMRIEANARQALVQDFQMKVAKHNWGRQIIEEGTADAAKALRIGDAQGMEDAFNKSGKYKIAPGLQITPAEIKNSDGSVKRTNVATFNIVKEDGTIVPMKMNTDELEKTVLSAKDAMSLDLQAEANAFERNYKSASLKEQVRSNKAHEGISFGQLALAQKKDQRDAESFKRQNPEGQIEFIEKSLGAPFSPEERKKYLLKAAGLGDKTEDHMKLAESLAADAVKSGSLKPEEAPSAIENIMAGFTNIKIEKVIKSELGEARGTSEYANLYQKALKKVTAERLELMGFKPPSIPTPSLTKPNPAPTSIAASVGLNRPIPKASEYQGKSDGQKFVSGAQNLASMLGNGINGLRGITEILTQNEKTVQLNDIRRLIETESELTPYQTRIAIEHGLMRGE